MAMGSTVSSVKYLVFLIKFMEGEGEKERESVCFVGCGKGREREERDGRSGVKVRFVNGGWKR